MGLNYGFIYNIYHILNYFLLVVLEAPNFWDNLEEVLQMYFYYFYLQTHILSLQAHILNIPKKNFHIRLQYGLHRTGNIEIGGLVISKCFFVQVCFKISLSNVSGWDLSVRLVSCSRSAALCT